MLARPPTSVKSTGTEAGSHVREQAEAAAQHVKDDERDLTTAGGAERAQALAGSAAARSRRRRLVSPESLQRGVARGGTVREGGWHGRVARSGPPFLPAAGVA